MTNACEVFYLPSNSGMPILFDFHFDFNVSSGKADYMKLATAFMAAISGYGKDIPFPPILLDQLDEDGIDQLLKDCEICPEKTFFLVDHSGNTHYSMAEDMKFKMCGCNGEMAAMESLEQGFIDVVHLCDMKRVYCQLNR